MQTSLQSMTGIYAEEVEWMASVACEGGAVLSIQSMFSALFSQ